MGLKGKGVSFFVWGNYYRYDGENISFENYHYIGGKIYIDNFEFYMVKNIDILYNYIAKQNWIFFIPNSGTFLNW